MSEWLSDEELAAWVRLIAVVELLPGVLDSQLRHDSDLSHFDYYVVAMLSEAPQRMLRMTELAAATNATLPRLSHVVRRLEDRGLVARVSCPEDARVTNALLTDLGWETVVDAAPGHVATVRRTVVDALNPTQIEHLQEICDAILTRLDPEGKVAGRHRSR